MNRISLLFIYLLALLTIGFSTCLANLQIHQINNLSLSQVTLFTDKAEVKRQFTTVLNKGLNHIVVENVTAQIDGNSIRVSGVGDGVIREVEFKTANTPKEQVKSPEIENLEQRLEEVNEKQSREEYAQILRKDQLQAIKEVFENLGNEAAKNSLFNSSSLKKDSLEGFLDDILEMHEKKAMVLQEKLRTSEKRIKNLKKEEEKLESRIKELREAGSTKRQILIALESQKSQSEVELNLGYQIYQAYWTPSYDIRVDTQGDGKNVTMQVTYYGNIRQSTGEDWTDIGELLLSTATQPPYYAMQVPKERPLNVGIQERQAAPKYYKTMEESAFSAKSYVSLAARPQLATDNLESKQGILSNTFKISDKRVIPSDHSDHKVCVLSLELCFLFTQLFSQFLVTIAALQMDRAFLHSFCAPKRNADVSLVASAINNSTYPFLPGQASFYLDKDFTSKSTLNTIPSGDKFEFSTGVDRSIVVMRKPSRQFSKKDNNVTILTNEENILVRNTKSDQEVVLTILEQIPRSTDGRVQVTLLLPKHNVTQESNNDEDENQKEVSMGKPEIGANLREGSVLEWTVRLTQSEQRNLVIKWELTYPANETLDYKEA